MKEIKEVKAYICPETGEKYLSRAEAERSAAAVIKAREEKRIAAEQKKLAEQSNLEKQDWIRLNATNIEEIPQLIEQKAKEFWGINCKVKIDVSFGKVSNSSNAPFGKKTNWSGENKNYPTSFLGWRGKIVAHFSNYKKKAGHFDYSISNVLFCENGRGIGFKGFYTGTGCPGDIGGEYPMDIGFSFFLEDFPKLAESYKLFKKEYQKVLDNKEDVRHLMSKAEMAVNTHQGVNKIADQIFNLNMELEQLKEEVRKKYILDNPVAPAKIDPRLEGLKEIFKSDNGYGEFPNEDYEYGKI